MSPHCRFSDLGPFRLRVFSAQVGNRTRAHGDESNPLEISMSSAMKGKPGLATGLTALGALHPLIRAWKSGHRNLCQARIEPGPGPIRFLLLYRGSSPFTHCATSAGSFISLLGICRMNFQTIEILQISLRVHLALPIQKVN